MSVTVPAACFVRGPPSSRVPISPQFPHNLFASLSTTSTVRAQS